MQYEEVCYTKEAGLQKAIEMENKSFEKFKSAYQAVSDRFIKELVKEVALDELKHKYNLEKAFFEETVALHESRGDSGPSLQLTVMLEEHPLDENATEQDVMINAIHEKKRTVDFYEKMTDQCAGAPMAAMFKNLAKEERGHLTRLEELYERVYMPEM